MVLNGRIEDGMVILSEQISLPDGTEVTVVIQPTADSAVDASSRAGQRVQLPLVPSKQPGRRQLTADMVAELLSDDELSS